METCAGKCAKYFLFVYNLLFVLSGAAVLGIGIWIRVDKDVEQLQELLNIQVDGYLYTAAYILIGFGSFVFLVGFLGCCGAVTENKCMLGTYIVLLVVIFSGELAGGISAAVYKDKVFDGLKSDLKDSLSKYAAGTTGKALGENAAAVAWDYFQVAFECCGAYNYTDYYAVKLPDNMKVPVTCCKLKNKETEQPVDEKQCQAAAATTDNINKDNKYLWTKNCFDGFDAMLKKNTNILIGIGCGVAFLQFLGIALACCVCRGGSKSQVYA